MLKLEVILVNEQNKFYYEDMFKEYADIVNPSELQEMLGIGRNKAYKLLRTSQIYNKRIGNNYYIPKYSVIEYILKK